MVLKVPFNFRDFPGNQLDKKRDFSVLANPSVVNGTRGIQAANVLLTETNFSLNKFDTVKSSVFNLFSLSATLMLHIFFCIPVSLFNSSKKRFGEFKDRVSRSSKYSRFFDRTSSQTRFLIFEYLVLLDGVRYRLHLLNAKFRRVMLFGTSLLNQVLFEFAR